MRRCHVLIVFLGLLVGAGVTVAPSLAADPPVSSESVLPGTAVHVQGDTVPLYGGMLAVGQSFLEIVAATDLPFEFNNKVTIVSIVPSLDTPVCEMQTYQLRTMEGIDPRVDVLTISRDLPMAQSRFARDHHIEDSGFISDYKSGSFGKASGLMMKGRELLARGIMVLDRQGVIRYLQIVPEVSHLPDIEKAVSVANALVSQDTSVENPLDPSQ